AHCDKARPHGCADAPRAHANAAPPRSRSGNRARPSPRFLNKLHPGRRTTRAIREPVERETSQKQPRHILGPFERRRNGRPGRPVENGATISAGVADMHRFCRRKRVWFRLTKASVWVRLANVPPEPEELSLQLDAEEMRDFADDPTPEQQHAGDEDR